MGLGHYLAIVLIVGILLGLLLAGSGCSKPRMDETGKAWLRHWSQQGMIAADKAQRCDLPEWDKKQWREESQRWRFVQEWLDGMRPDPGPKQDELGIPWPKETP